MPFTQELKLGLFLHRRSAGSQPEPPKANQNSPKAAVTIRNQPTSSQNWGCVYIVCKTTVVYKRIPKTSQFLPKFTLEPPVAVLAPAECVKHCTTRGKRRFSTHLRRGAPRAEGVGGGNLPLLRCSNTPDKGRRILACCWHDFGMISA